MAEPEGIAFRNDGASTIPAYGLCRVTGATTVLTQPVLTVDRPSVSAFARHYLVNGPESVAPNGYGAAQFGPVFKIVYDTGTAAYGDSYGAVPGSHVMTKGYPSDCFVIANWDATNRIMEAYWDSIKTFIGKTTTSGGAGSTLSGTATSSYKIYAGTLGSESDAGWTSNMPPVRFRAAVSSDKWFRATWVNNGWEGETLEC